MIKKKVRREDDEDNGFAGWGGYMAAKIAKLEGQFLHHAGKATEEKQSDIFKGIAIYVNGYTVPTADELKRIMMLHGGIYHHYESHCTTHIIASNLPDTKVKQLKTLNVVKPSWIVDSLAAGRLLDYRKYLLYSNQTKSQPRLNFQAHDIPSTSSTNDTKSLLRSEAGRGNSSDNVSESMKQGNECVVSKENGSAQSKNGICDFKSGNCGIKTDLENINRATLSREEIIPKASISSPIKPKSPGASRKTAVEPEFLSEFYGNSRLHHLSTMGATFKEYVAKLRAVSQGEFPGLKRLTDWKRTNSVLKDMRVDDDFVDDFMEESFIDSRSKKVVAGPKTIMHIDMDCFFVSVGLRNRPELRGLPVAVTHAKGNSSHVREGANRQFERNFYQQRFQNRIKQKQSSTNESEEVVKRSRLDDVGEKDSLSEIASCNYEARDAGVKNGMFFGAAIKLCPNLKTIPYDFEGYKEVSYKLYDTLASYTLDIEAVSCDEMYVDCTEVLKKANVTALEFATFLRAEIKDVTGCNASAGFGSNPLQARLATKKAKPNGQFHLLPTDVELFMHNIKVEDLPGVGYSLAYRLHAEGISTCRDLQRISLASLQKKFGGKTGEALHRHARGEDARSLDVCHQRKSVSAEVNYGIRFTSQAEAEAFLKQLAEEVVTRMRQAQVKGRQVTLKLMIRAKDAPVETAKFMGHGACDNISRSTSLGAPTDDVNIIFREAIALERQLKVSPSDLRGVGIQMSRLVHLAAKSSKNTLLTNFLGQNKATGEENKKEKAVGSVQNEEIKNKNDQSQTVHSEIKSIPNPAESGESCNDKNTIERRTSLHIDEDRKVYGNDSNSRDCSSVQKETTVKSNQTGSINAVNLKNDELPLLTPPVEVPMMTLAQARKLIRAWVLSEVYPQKCDVVMFSSYIQRLVIARHLENVDILFSMLHRLLINKGRSWKVAYQSIVKNTQTIMQAVYGADLKVPEFD